MTERENREKTERERERWRGEREARQRERERERGERERERGERFLAKHHARSAVAAEFAERDPGGGAVGVPRLSARGHVAARGGGERHAIRGGRRAAPAAPAVYLQIHQTCDILCFPDFLRFLSFFYGFL